MISEDVILKALMAFIVIALIFSVIPYFIAQSRKAVHTIPILWISLIVGWTAVGWLAAFIWACVDKVEDPKESEMNIEGESASGIDAKESTMDEEELERQISEAMANENFATVRHLVGKRKYP
jgi:4-amino-4-deoxy-L-arabinose transferase-like glycosyltransferase